MHPPYDKSKEASGSMSSEAYPPFHDKSQQPSASTSCPYPTTSEACPPSYDAIVRNDAAYIVSAAPSVAVQYTSVPIQPPQGQSVVFVSAPRNKNIKWIIIFLVFMMILNTILWMNKQKFQPSLS